MTHPTDDNQFCPHCRGSGEGRAITNHLGPDDHEYDCQCPTCGGDGSLLAAFHVANETRKRLERECEMRYQERRALVRQRDHYLSVLTDIFALTVSNPDGVEVNGVRYVFNDPNAPETLRGLSKALRAIAEKAPEVRALLAEQARTEPDLVPGVMHCARCKFRLNRINLNVNVGTVTAGDNKTEPCPNGCGPLWPVTWKQEAEEAMTVAEGLCDRAVAAERELADLRERLGPRAAPPLKAEQAKDAAEDAEILAAVHRELDDGDRTGNAPGHDHKLPGIWDDDNGAKSGKPCAWCLTWVKFTALIDRAARAAERKA